MCCLWRGPRVLKACCNAVTQFALSCCNTLKYEPPGFRREDASFGCHCHFKLWVERGVSLSEHHPFTKTTHGISVSLTDLAVGPHLSLGAPSAGSGHKKLSTQGSSSHYAHLKPGCRANQWPVHEDAITTVRLDVLFVDLICISAVRSMAVTRLQTKRAWS